VKKTGRLLVVHDSPEYGGYSAEVVACVAGDEVALAALHATPKRLCGKESPITVCTGAGTEVIPSTDAVVQAVRSLF
jgi:2-oxoisovalerate dehydrogenase E1 component